MRRRWSIGGPAAVRWWAAALAVLAFGCQGDAEHSRADPSVVAATAAGSFTEPGVGGDLDGDGDADVAILCDEGDATANLLALHSPVDPDGGAMVAATLWRSTAGAFDARRGRVVSGDVDGDGVSEVVVLCEANEGCRELVVFRSTGGGESCAPAVAWTSRPGDLELSGTRLGCGDVDGDRRCDIVLLCDRGREACDVRVLLSREDGSFVARRFWRSPRGGLAFARSRLACADADGDGRADAIVLSGRRDGTVRLRALVSTGGSFVGRGVWRSWRGRLPLRGARLAAGDLDGDGRADAAVLGRSKSGALRLRGFFSEGGSFVPRTLWSASAAVGAWRAASLSPGDLNGDGRCDLVALCRGADGGADLNALISGDDAFSAWAAWSAPASALAFADAWLAIDESVVACPDVVGRTLFVAPDGDDERGDGSKAAPWASPGYASRQLQPGDTLVIAAGTYRLDTYPDDIVTPPAGLPGAPVTIRGEVGARPVLAGGADLAMAIDIAGARWLTVRDLEITSDAGERFREGVGGVGGPVSHIRLEGLYIHHLDEMAVDIADAYEIVIDDCRFEYCGFGGIGGPAARAGGWQRAVVSRCRLSYAGHYYRGVVDNPDLPYDRPDGLGLELSAGPLEIADTVAEHNRGDGLDSKVADTSIHECVVANNRCDGVKLWQGDSSVVNTLVYGTGDGVGGASPWAGVVIDEAARPGARFTITNVTLHDNADRHAYPIYVCYEGDGPPIELTVRNSIFAGGHGEVHLGDAARATVEHCLFFRPGGDPQVHANGREYSAEEIRAGSLGAGNLVGDPLFMAPTWGTQGDYRLRDGSPAIDAGTPMGAPVTDLLGVARPQGGAVDIGAHERSR